MERETRTVADSRVEQIQIVMPEHINGYGRLFGGQLVALGGYDALWLAAAALLLAQLVLGGRALARLARLEG